MGLSLHPTAPLRDLEKFRKISVYTRSIVRPPIFPRDLRAIAFRPPPPQFYAIFEAIAVRLPPIAEISVGRSAAASIYRYFEAIAVRSPGDRRALGADRLN